MKQFVQRIFVFLFIQILFSFNYGFAQGTPKLRITKSEERKWKETNDDKKVNTNNILGFASDSSNNYYLLKSVDVRASKYDVLYADVYNTSLKFEDSHPIDLKAKGERNVQLEDFFELNHKPTVFYSQYDNKNDTKTLYFEQFDSKGNITRGDQLLSFVTKSIYRGSYDLIYSLDSSKFMIVVNTPQKSRDDLVNAAFVYDKNFNKIKKYDIDFGIKASKITYNYMVTNEGYPMIYLSMPRESKNKDLSKLQKKILIYKESNTPISFNLDMDKNEIESLICTKEKNNQMTFVGTYSLKNKSSAIGNCFLIIDANAKKVVKAKVDPFNQSINDFFKISPSRAAKGSGISSLIPIFGGSSLAGSNFFVGQIQYSITTRNKYGTYTTFYQQSAVCTKYDDMGNLKFTRIVPLNNLQSESTYGLKMDAFVYQDLLGVIYNTHIDNIEPKSNKPIKTIKNIKRHSPNLYSIFSTKNDNVIALTMFDQAGKTSVISVSNYSKDEKFIKANSKIQFSGNQFVLAAEGRGAFKIFRGMFE